MRKKNRSRKLRTNKLKNNKKAIADLVLQPAFVTFLILGILLISLMTAIANLGSNSFYEKKYDSRDFALLIDSAFAAKDNVYFLYSPISNSSFDIKKEGIVSVFEKTKKDPQKSEFKFIPGSIPLIPGNLSNLKTAIITKTKSELKIDKLNDDFNPNFHLLDCNNERFELGNILVDSSDLLLKEETFKLVAHFENSLRSSASQKLSIEERISQSANADSVISFAFEDKDHRRNHIKAYYNVNSKKAKTSRNLACNILNKISSEFTDFVDGVSLIPLNIDHLDLSDERRVLSHEDKVGVFLVLGNVQIKRPNLNILASHINKVISNA